MFAHFIDIQSDRIRTGTQLHMGTPAHWFRVAGKSLLPKTTPDPSTVTEVVCENVV